MLTISYFINILIDQYENCNLESTHFEEQKLDAWKGSISFYEITKIWLSNEKVQFESNSTLQFHRWSFSSVRLGRRVLEESN